MRFRARVRGPVNRGVRGQGLRSPQSPHDPIVDFDPAHVLGWSREQALHLFGGRPVTRGEAEAIATRHDTWRGHLRVPDSAPLR